MARPTTGVTATIASSAGIATPPRADAGPASPPSAGAAFGSPDAPVRVEVAMPRALFDRLTGHDDAPRCRYDEHTGLAEFVAQPGFAHEGPAWQVGQLFVRIADALAERGHDVAWQHAGALRLLSDDGAFEPDAGFYRTHHPPGNGTSWKRGSRRPPPTRSWRPGRSRRTPCASWWARCTERA
ncbi:MAG: hypothetical protein OXH75_17365 [Acidobacteria bacterium]|nr:hypothetical protein [Acidobacteriota bacterium]